MERGKEASIGLLRTIVTSCQLNFSKFLFLLCCLSCDIWKDISGCDWGEISGTTRDIGGLLRRCRNDESLLIRNFAVQIRGIVVGNRVSMDLERIVVVAHGSKARRVTRVTHTVCYLTILLTMGKRKSTTLLSDDDSEQEQADTTTKKQKKKAESSCAQCLTRPKNADRREITAMTEFIRAKEALASTQAKASPGPEIESRLHSLEVELQKANRRIADLESTLRCKCRHTFKSLHLCDEHPQTSKGCLHLLHKLYNHWLSIRD